MRITDPGAAAHIAESIRAFRHGNRLMARANQNLHLTFFRRDEPETKLGTLRLEGLGDFSLVDAAIALGTALFAVSLMTRIACILRRLR